MASNEKIAALAIQYVAASSALIKRALDELQVHRAAQQKAASMRPELLDRMLATGAAQASQKQAAEAMLGSHAETLGLLKTAIDKLGDMKTQMAKQASVLGEGVTSPATGAAPANGYDSLTDPYVGRRTSAKKASDLALMKVLEAPGV